MRVKQIRRTIIIGVLALIGIVVIQVYWLFTTWNMQQEKLDEKIWLALKKVSAEINVLHDCLPNDLNPVQQLSETCYLVDVGCEYNQGNLEHLVHTNFNKVNLNIEHEIAIYDCNLNKMVFIGRFSASGDKIAEPLNPSFCLDAAQKDIVYFFCINISGRNTYLFQKMTLWLILSCIVIVVVLFFTFTIFSFFKQKQLAELQKDFINNMTHEFKTPISSIQIASDVLLGYESENLPARFTNYARLIKQENARLNLLVENVLRAARIEKDQTLMNLQRIDLHQVIAEVFTEGFLKSQPKEMEFNSRLIAERPIIKADKLHLTNILFNLTDNAIKYNTCLPVHITIETKNEGNHLILSFSDNGIGIPEKFQKQVFNKFFRVPTGNIHDVKGFGLGLYYVKQVCDAHKWKISCQSELPAGVKFMLKIPIDK
jgi:two-component system phosphate regulon sensor histidine kinase PhoR